MPTVAPALPALIACVDASEDVLLLLRDRMIEAGYRAVTYSSPVRYGSQPVVDFVTYLAPPLALFNVGPPYRESWAEYQHLRREVPECEVVPVTTHKAALERLVGPTDALEVLATADDLDALIAEIALRLAAVVDGRVAAVLPILPGLDGHASGGPPPRLSGDGRSAGRDGAS